MKNFMTLLLAAAMLLSVISLSSCGLLSFQELDSKHSGRVEQTDKNGNPIDDDGNSGSGNDLPYSRDSAQAKLEELGKTEGYEVTLKVTGADGTQNVTVTGRKGN